MKPTTLLSILAVGLGAAADAQSQGLRYRGGDLLPYNANSSLQLVPSGSAPSGELVRATAAAAGPWGLSARMPGATALALSLDVSQSPVGTVWSIATGRRTYEPVRLRLRRAASGWDLGPTQRPPQSTGATVQVFRRHDLVTSVDVANYQQPWTIGWQLDSFPVEWRFLSPLDPCRFLPHWWIVRPPIPDEVFLQGLELSKAVPIAVDGHVPVVGDEIRVIFRGPQQVDAIDRVDVFTASAAVAQLDLLEVHTGAFGAGAAALGDVKFERRIDGLHVTDVQQPGDGVSMHFGRGRCVMAALPDGLPLGDGDAMEWRAVGARGGKTGQSFGALRAERHGNRVEIRQDFTALFGAQPGTFDIDVLDGGVRIHREAGVSLVANEIVVIDGIIIIDDIVIIFDYVRSAGDHGAGPGGALPELNCAIKLDKSQQFDVACGNGQFLTVTGDEIRIRPTIGLMDFEWISDIELRNATVRNAPVSLRIADLPFASMPSLFVSAAEGDYAQPVLRVNGSAGGLGRRVGVAAGQSINVTTNAPGSTAAVAFAMIDVPHPQDGRTVLGLDLLFDMLNPAIAVSLPSTFSIPHPGVPLTLTMQAVLLDPGQPIGLGISNGLVLDLHQF